MTLTATPAADSTFVGWTGDASCPVVTLDAPHACTATFDQVFHALTVTVDGTGTGSVTAAPAGIDCGADCTEAYLQATVVTLTATPAADSTFVGWTGDASCPVMTLDTAHACTATFDQAFHALTMTIDWHGHRHGDRHGRPGGNRLRG